MGNRSDDLEAYLESKFKFCEKKIAQLNRSCPLDHSILQYLQKSYDLRHELERVRKVNAVECNRYNGLFNEALLHCLQGMAKHIPDDKRAKAREDVNGAAESFNKGNPDFRITLFDSTVDDSSPKTE